MENTEKSGAFCDVERLDSLSPDELIQIILDQQRLIELLRAEIEQLKRRGIGGAIFQRNPQAKSKASRAEAGARILPSAYRAEVSSRAATSGGDS